MTKPAAGPWHEFPKYKPHGDGCVFLVRVANETGYWHDIAIWEKDYGWIEAYRPESRKIIAFAEIDDRINLPDSGDADRRQEGEK